MENDIYRTIDVQGEGIYSEKRSKFLAFAIPVLTVEDVKREVEAYQKKYYDARHVCYAYRLGERRELFRANDNGEPSGTAGKPILGQIDSRELTNVLVIVVRYFGGIKLGTSGLIVAYKAAAAEALDATEHVEKTINEEITLKFSYPLLNDVLRIVKEENPRIVEQVFDNECVVRLSIRLSRMPRLRERYEKLVIDSRGDLIIVDNEEEFPYIVLCAIDSENSFFSIVIPVSPKALSPLFSIMNLMAACALTEHLLLSNGGAKAAIPSIPGRTPIIPPLTPVFAGIPDAKSHSSL